MPSRFSHLWTIIATIAGVIGAGGAAVRAEQTFECKVDLFQSLDIERAGGAVRDGRGPFKITITPDLQQPHTIVVKHKFLGQDQSYEFWQPEIMTSSFASSYIEFETVLTIAMEMYPNNKDAYGATFVIQLPSAMHAWTLLCAKA